MSSEPSAEFRSQAATGGQLRLLSDRIYGALLLAFVLWVCHWSVRRVWSFTIDDAGISYAYAKHIAEGWGPVAVVGGPRVEGYSNPSWVLLLVPFHALGLSLPLVAKVLGGGALAGTLAAAAAYLSRVEARQSRCMRASWALFAALLAGCLEFVVWVVAGLENALFAFLLLLLAALHVSPSSAAMRPVAAGLTAFVLCITRPEGALYAAGWLALELGRGLVFSKGDGRKRARRAAAIAGLSMALPLALYHAVHYAIFRQLLPNTFVAKPPTRGWEAGAEYLGRELVESGLAYALPFALIGCIRSFGQKALLAWYCVAGSSFVLYSGGDWMPHGRFVALFAPALLTLAVCGASDLVFWSALLTRGRLPREPMTVAFAAVVLWGWGVHHVPRLKQLERRSWCHFCERVDTTRRLERLVGRAGLGAVSFLTHDFGGPAWLSDEELYPLDFLGLCDRSIALIRRERRERGGSIGDEARLYQYVMHEQPTPPSWVFLPANFWPQLDKSPEWRSGYLPLPRGSLRGAPRNAFVALHRSELVDYFPPVPRFEFRELVPGLSLLGFKVLGAPVEPMDPGAPLAEAGARVRVLLSLLVRRPLKGSERVSVEAAAGGARARSSTERVLPQLRGVDSRALEGDPVSVELELTLPASEAPAFELALHVHAAPGRASRSGAPGPSSELRVPLGQLAARSALPSDARSLPRYPAALPVALEPDLRRWEGHVARVFERRRRAEDLTLADHDLARELSRLGHALEDRGVRDQAYLAYVWATQVSRGSWRELADPIHRLRPPLPAAAHALELSLLRDYYAASGDASALRRLLAFYLGTARLTRAEYFLERARGFELDPALQAALDRLTPQLARPAGGELELELPREIVRPAFATADFEVPGALDGWQGDLVVFRAAEVDAQRRLGLRGQHGAGVLSSLGKGKRGRGQLLSPEFELDGARLTLRVGGSARRAGVELLVGGRAVRTAAGSGSDFLAPVVWDISEYQGQTAQLRVFDRDPRFHVLVDEVLVWR